MKNGQLTNRSHRVLIIVSAILWLFVWQAAAGLANRSLLIPIPTPLSTGAALLRLLGEPSFYFAVLWSVIRIAIGFALAFLAGTALAILCVRFALLEILTAPLFQLIRAIPVASFTILVFLWIARERIPSVISFFTVLPIVWATMTGGLKSVDAELIEMATVFGMPRMAILREILLPGIRPFAGTAITSGIGFAWKSGVAAEVICRTQDSIGNLLWAGKASVEYDEVFALTLVIVLLSVLIEKGVGWLVMGRRKTEAGTRGVQARENEGA